MSIEKEARIEHPKRAVNDKDSKKVHKLILDNHKVKLIEITETLKVRKTCAGLIANEYIEYNHYRIDESEQNLVIKPKFPIYV